MIEGKKYLINCDYCFFAPDGNSYKAVWGTVYGILEAEKALGIKTNAKSTNWYVLIGDMIVAGCQIHFAMRCDNMIDLSAPTVELEHEGQFKMANALRTRIYDADASGLVAAR